MHVGRCCALTSCTMRCVSTAAAMRMLVSPLGCDVVDVVVVVVIDELEDDRIVLTTTFIAQLKRGSAVIKQGILCDSQTVDCLTA